MIKGEREGRRGERGRGGREGEREGRGIKCERK